MLTFREVNEGQHIEIVECEQVVGTLVKFVVAVPLGGPLPEKERWLVEFREGILFDEELHFVVEKLKELNA